MTRVENFVRITIKNCTMQMANILLLETAKFEEVVSGECLYTQKKVDSVQRPHTSLAVFSKKRVITSPRPKFRQKRSFTGRDVRNLLRSWSGEK